jgi:hypothetical protein
LREKQFDAEGELGSPQATDGSRVPIQGTNRIHRRGHTDAGHRAVYGASPTEKRSVLCLNRHCTSSQYCQSKTDFFSGKWAMCAHAEKPPLTIGKQVRVIPLKIGFFNPQLEFSLIVHGPFEGQAA